MIVDDGHGPHPYDKEFCNPNCLPVRVREVAESLRELAGLTLESGDNAELERLADKLEGKGK